MMERTDGDLDRKPITTVAENATEPLHIEESREDNTAKPADSLTPLIDKEGSTSAPLAEPEEDEADIGKPPVINLSDRFGTFPYAPGFGPTLNGVANISPESIPDVNLYQHKKTVAQGMMDLALFSANANQLRYVLESSNHSYYYPGIVLISFSLIFQVAVGVGLLWNTRYNIKNEKEMSIANKVNNFTVVGIFLITVINVFISAFGTTTGASSAPTPAI
ncbi:hypothetical protein Trydic_g22676 [Trypoxylus dichotomus]